MKKIGFYYIALIMVLFIGLSLPEHGYAGIDEGIKAYENGDYKTALKEFRKAAKAGDAGAQFYLGRMYYNGEGVSQDYEEAVKWFSKSAEQGYVGSISNTEDNRGFKSITEAVRSGNADAVRYFIKEGADVNAEIDDGPILNLAARKGYTQVVRLFIINGADVNAKDRDGNTALIDATKTYKNHIDVVKLLIENGADVNA
ncbi:MAG: ankyrin repeat domain-containing protein, partial [Deltaproteobacteria bacterium]|nr:ankyrin repeat domain-containing protein [Deltaproteobacteria bacterium]